MAKGNNGTEINLSTFSNSIKKMIATSESSYDNISFRKGRNVDRYTRDEVLQRIESGTSDELREISNFYYYTSGFYRRFLTYYATLLKYAYLVIPHMNGNKKIGDKKMLDRYNNAVKFTEDLGLKSLSEHIALTVLIDGAYYGIFRDFGQDGCGVQDLPCNYCRSRYKNQQGIAVVEIDVTYFDKIRDATVRQQVLGGYPKNVRRAYDNYHKNHGDKWFMLEPEQSLYFNIADERPYFSSILPAIIDFKEYRDIEKKKDLQDLNSILVQELPIQDGELVIDPEEAVEIHNGSVNMLQNNNNTDVLTTYAKVKVESMESNRSVVTNNLEKIEKSIYGEAGVSKQLFSAEGNTALKHSITNDMAIMLMLGKQIANWVEYLVNLRFSDKNIRFKVDILPLSHYNESEVRKEALSLAQSGYSFIIPALTFDLRQSDLADIKALEISALKLNEIMIPLASSYTTSSGNPTQEDVNKKDDDQKSDKTIQNINSDGERGE